MLQHDPSKRLSIREILTHPWFKLTIVDKVYPNGDVPSIPTSPNATSPTAAAAAASGATAAGDDFFESASRQQPRLTPHVAGPSPLSTHLPTTPRQDSASSDTANGRSQSQSQSQSTSKMARLNSAEFSTTEKELEQLHLCTSPAAAAAAAPRSVSSPSMRGKTLRTLPEGQVDVDDPNNAEGDDRLPFIDEHLHLPVALHSRTPSRTKRRSVSSTLSLERRLSHHSAHHSYITFPPEDYLSKLDPSVPPSNTSSTPATTAPAPAGGAGTGAAFTTPSETRLLRQLDQIGLDVGQLKHSVETDACDASAGLWWLLRQKQQERGEDVREVKREREKEKEKEVKREKEKASNATGTTGVMGIRPGKQGVVGKSSEGLRFREEQVSEAGAGAIPAISSFTSLVDLGPPVLPLPLPLPLPLAGEQPGLGLGTQDDGAEAVITPPLDDNSASGIELATFSQSPVNPAPGANAGAGAGAGAGPKTPKRDKRDRSPNPSPLHSRDRDRDRDRPAHPVGTSLSNINASTGAKSEQANVSTNANANAANVNANANANTKLKGKSPSMNMLQRATSVLGGVGKKADDKDKDKEKDKNGMNERGDLDSSNSREEKKASIGIGGGGGASTGKSNSPNKLKKPIPGAGMKGLATTTTTLSKSESESEGLLATSTSLGAGGGGGGGGHSPAVSASGSKTVTPGSSPQRKGLTPQETPRGGLRDAKAPSLAGENTNGTSGGGNGNGNGKGKGGKKDSLWTTFRHLFYEDRRRRNKRQSGTPTSSSASPLVPSEVKLPAGAVVLSRGANSRTSHHKRSNVGYAPSTGSRRTSLEGNRPVYSRRSSSIHTNSRRSSVGSLHFQDHQTMISDLSRRASQRSHGSQTPTSDREYLDFSSAAAAPISRQGSSHSIRGGVGGGSRHSSFSVRSPSLNAETPSASASASASTRFKSSVPPASPLLGYRRRPAGGNDSSRVRHIKVIPESQIMRSSSVASSIRSNPSSRASSMDRDRDRDRESEYESGRDDVSSRSGRRQKKRNGSQRSLAQQIHRTRSPLALSLENTYSSNSVGSIGLGLGGTNRNPKKPLRDVFQKKGKRKDGDDEWVSEDEDEFACGLGQGRGVARRFSNSSGNGTVWMNVDSKANPARSAAAFPTSRIVSQSTSQGGGSRRRERGRKSSLEEERGRPQEGKGKVKGETVAQGLMGMESLSGRNRRNLPDRSTAPGIIEEEEEDEE